MTDWMDTIRNNVIGERTLFETAFGMKPLVYADYTASGRALGCIEDTLRNEVLYQYANTHTETTFTGHHMTQLREQARALIHEATGASDDHVVIFCGSGATAAIHKTTQVLGLHRKTAKTSEDSTQRPVVFIGPYEHHSNELPWRECDVELVKIGLTADGRIDSDQLRGELRRFNDHRLKIGSFSAASNVTGMLTDCDEISSILHEHGALAFWDFAAAAPYVDIDVGGADSSFTKDAVFISPHKFVGGPETPGILIIRKSLLNNAIPSVPAGGTVSYVTPSAHRYSTDCVRREEGGTPSIIGAIRAGLVFRLQQLVGLAQIKQNEHRLIKRALARFKAHPNIDLLGNTEADRLAIISFRIRHHERHLHYGFVIALLNDLFGIQARGGCSCAGPYAHHLLKLDKPTSLKLERAVADGFTALRPGWVRINFNYFMDDDTLEYLLSAVELIANYGANLLPMYAVDMRSGVWRHRQHPAASTGFLDLEQWNPGESSAQAAVETISADQLAMHLSDARDVLLNKERLSLVDSQPPLLPPEHEQNRWFVLPSDISDTSDPAAAQAQESARQKVFCRADS